MVQEMFEMYAVEITYRHRNDFQFIAYCRHCEKKSRHGDGYADAYYQQVVFPHRHCEHCGMDEYGEAKPHETESDSVAAELTP